MLRRYGIGICLVCTSMLLTACYGPVVLTDSHEVRLTVLPDTEMVKTAKVGDAMVVRASETIAPALRISAVTTFGKAEGEGAFFYCGLTFEPGVIPQRGSIKSMGRSGICFGPYRGSSTEWDGATNENCRGAVAQMDICEDTSDGTFFVYHPSYNKGPVIPLEQDFQNITKIEMVVSNDLNFKKEIVYLGRSENELKILYRESHGDLSKPSYEKEWDVEIGTKSTLVTHGGAKIEIVSASDDEVQFRVESNLQ